MYSGVLLGTVAVILGSKASNNKFPSLFGGFSIINQFQIAVVNYAFFYQRIKVNNVIPVAFAE
jgi:hypothetical protein